MKMQKSKSNKPNIPAATENANVEIANNTVKIEKNIPIPPRTKVVSKYRFNEMEIGDSFSIETFNEVRKLRGYICSYCNRNKNYKFSIRQFENVWRCWRIKA